MTQKVFVIRKFIPADTIEEAISLEHKVPVHECFLNDYARNQFLEELAAPQTVTGFHKETTPKKS